MIGTFRKYFRSITRGDIVMALAALAVIWTAAFLHLSQEKNNFLTAARDSAHNLSRAFAEHISGEIRSVDQTLLLLRRDWARDPRHFVLSDWAKSTNSIDGMAIQLSLIGPTGILEQTNAGFSKPIDLSDREHFAVQRNGAGDALFISKPVLGRASGKWTIQFTRRLNDEQGGFAGVIVGSVDAYQLSHFYETISVGKQGAITLLGTDGIVRARAPIADGSLGRQMKGTKLYDALQNEESGVYIVDSTLDGVRRIVAFHRVPGFPIAVSVGLGEAEILAHYYSDLVTYLIAATILSLGVLTALGFSVFYRQRHLAAKAALDATLENVAQGVLMIAPDRGIAVMNSKAIELLGLPEELVDHRPTFDELLEWQLESGEFGPASEKSPLRLLAENGGIAPGDSVYERERHDGRHLEVRTRVLPDGAAVRTYTDVTDHRRAEQVLASALAAAERASEARARFLAIVSHEIRTPMNGVIGLAELLLRTDLNDEQARWINTLRASADHLLRLIDDILDFTRLNTDEIEFDAIPFDPVAVAREAFECIESRAVEKGLAHEIEVQGTGCTVCGDPARLRQVLINLLGNAVKFTAAGGVKLSVHPATIREQAATLSFSVEDSGIGIAREGEARLFREFSQVDGTIARRFGGSGLGLAISKRLVERMGGEITVESEPGAGSTFTVVVHLPLIAVGTTQGTPPVLVEAMPFRPLRILLAEDDATNRLVATAMLHKMGHSVYSAGDGVAALAAAQEQVFDLILMDVMMPVMDGLAASRAIRALPPPFGETPIVALTANASNEDGERCRKAGMDDYLTKPITFDRLLKAMDRVADRHLIDSGSLIGKNSRHDSRFDSEMLRKLAESLGNESVAEIREAYLGELSDRLDRIEHCYRQPDWEGLKREAHSLKSSSAALGLKQLSELAASIEHALSEASPVGSKIAIQPLRTCAETGAGWLRGLEFSDPAI